MHTFALIWHFFVLKLKREMIFKVNFWMQVLSRVSYIIVLAIFFEIVYQHVSAIGGFSHNEMLLLVGTTGITLSIFRTFFQATTWRLGNLIRYGGIEFIITKPIDLKLFAASCEPDPTEIMGLPIPLAIIIIASKGANYPLWRWLLWLSGIFLGIALFLEILLSINALHFKFVSIRAMIWIVQDFLEFTRFPFTVYPNLLKFILIFGVPVFFISNFSVMLLTGKIKIIWFAIGFCLAIFWWILVDKLWLLGMKHYEGAGTSV